MKFLGEIFRCYNKYFLEILSDDFLHADNAEEVSDAVGYVDAMTTKINNAKSNLQLVSADLLQYLQNSTTQVETIKANIVLESGITELENEIQRYSETYSKSYSSMYSNKCSDMETIILSKLDIPEYSQRMSSRKQILLWNNKLSII